MPLGRDIIDVAWHIVSCQERRQRPDRSRVILLRLLLSDSCTGRRATAGKARGRYAVPRLWHQRS